MLCLVKSPAPTFKNIDLFLNVYRAIIVVHLRNYTYMRKLESYVKVLEEIITEVLLPSYNKSLVNSGRVPVNIKRLVLSYRMRPIAALLQPKRRKS